MNDPLESLVGHDGPTLAQRLEAGPMLRVYRPNGAPRAAVCVDIIEAPIETVWKVVERPDGFAQFVNMVDAVVTLPGRSGEDHLVRVDLRFKISIFSRRFHFVAAHHLEDGRLTRLSYREGKVRDVEIEIELLPAGPERTILRCHIGFDQTSLGWLVKVFIRHHPEIDWGVHTGSVMSVSSSVKRVAEALAP